MTTCQIDMTPYYADKGSKMITQTLDRTQHWHQIGWLGIATNQVWSLDDPAWETDPAGVSPLWVLADNDHAVPGEVEGGVAG
ncbi:MAG TPA: hypothetical protein VF678_02720 [bacterium]